MSSSTSMLTATQKYAAGALFALALHQAQIHQTHPLGFSSHQDDDRGGPSEERVSTSSSTGFVSDDHKLWVHQSSGLLRPVFKFLEIDSRAWGGLEETVTYSPAKNHVGAMLPKKITLVVGSLDKALENEQEVVLVMEEERMKGEEEKMIPREEMAKSPNGESVPAAVNWKAEDSNPNDRRESPSSSTKKANTAEATTNGNKAKSCKGCLYYSSRFKADSRNPLCVGFSRSLPNVPRYIVGESEMEASKEGRSLTDFRYGCVGYSLYTDQKDQTSSGQQTQTELPVCIGLEVLVDRRLKTADSASVPHHIHNKEDGNGLPQRQSPKPTNATGEEFLSRFTRNANIVANGVAKNVRRVGNQIKQSIDDILYPYRRRPK